MRNAPAINSSQWMKKLKQYNALLFILPALFFYVMFMIVPIFNTARLSLYKWDGASPKKIFIGFDNYTRVIQDPIFWKALSHNLIWIAATIAIPVTLGLILAILLTVKHIKGVKFFRLVYFMPAVISLVAVGIVWGWMYHPQRGVFNLLLSKLGLGRFVLDWLGDGQIVLYSLVIAGSWTYYGFCMVIFLAALQGIDRSFYEVAKLEGANPLQTLIKVTIPLLKNTITLLVMYSLIGSFKVFDIIYVMTKGGPYNSSEVIATYMYSKTFMINEVGYGSALSISLALIIAISSIVYIRIAERNK